MDADHRERLENLVFAPIDTRLSLDTRLQWFLDLIGEIERAAVEVEMRRLGVHLSHCNFGENAGSCKYGDADCPALRGWSWFGEALDRRK